MRRVSKNQVDEKWLKALGKHINELIMAKGYNSAYDFWIKKAGDHISRSALNAIVAGTVDPGASTLKLVARLLDLKTSALFDFEKR